MSNKKSMYEILEIDPAASLEQIKAAHRRLSFRVMSDQLRLGREECEHQLNLLDVALHTLSNPVLRDAYDAELTANKLSSNAVVPVHAVSSSPTEQIRALALIAEMEGNYKVAVRSGERETSSMLQTASSAISASAQSLKVILRVVVGLFILLMVLMMSRGAGSLRQGEVATAEMMRAEEKLMILEYYKRHGVWLASRAEVEFYEAEDRRRENAQRAAEFEEKKRQEEYNQFIEESNRLGEQAHQEVVQFEREQEYLRKQEEMEKREREERAKEEEQQRLQRELDRYRVYR